MRQIQRKQSALRDVTVALKGWRGETRMLSVVEPHWYVELRFDSGAQVFVHTVFESDNYEKAHTAYETFKRITDKPKK